MYRYIFIITYYRIFNVRTGYNIDVNTKDQGCDILKKDLISILCMTLLCATVMLGIMGIYRILGSPALQRSGKIAEAGITTAFPERIICAYRTSFYG